MHRKVCLSPQTVLSLSSIVFLSAPATANAPQNLVKCFEKNWIDRWLLVSLHRTRWPKILRCSQLKHAQKTLNLHLSKFQLISTTPCYFMCIFNELTLWFYFFQGQTVLEVLERLGEGLHEPEVWALCRECVLAMQRNRLELRKSNFTFFFARNNDALRFPWTPLHCVEKF